MEYYVTMKELSGILGVGAIINIVLLAGITYAIDIFVSDEVRRWKETKPQRVSLRTRLTRFRLLRFNGRKEMPATHC